MIYMLYQIGIMLLLPCQSLKDYLSLASQRTSESAFLQFFPFLFNTVYFLTCKNGVCKNDSSTINMVLNKQMIHLVVNCRCTVLLWFEILVFIIFYSLYSFLYSTAIRLLNSTKSSLSEKTLDSIFLSKSVILVLKCVSTFKSQHLLKCV